MVVVLGSNYKNCKALTGKILVFWISGRFWGYPVTSPLNHLATNEIANKKYLYILILIERTSL